MENPTSVPQNPHLKGRLWISNDHGSVPAALQLGYVVLAVVDVGDCAKYRKMGCFAISNLLPPSSAVVSLLNDGNYPNYFNQYMFFLSQEAEGTIAMILAALHQKPLNFLLFSEYDADMEFHILDILTNYFGRTYGIICGIFGRETDSPAYNMGYPEYISRLADALFVNGVNGKPYITRTQYALMMPQYNQNNDIRVCVPSMRACSILFNIYNYGFTNQYDYFRTGLGLLDNLRKEAQTGMVNPMVVSPNLTADAINQIQERYTNEIVNENAAKFGKI